MTTTFSPSAYAGTTAAPKAAVSAETAWRAAALSMLSVRFIQGFVYWGGGSRRFIYAPSKLNPDSTSWMANKFQTAMPGALLGTDHIISYLLQHFWLLYPAVILFSAAELIAGLMLIVGFMTRAAAAVSMGFSVVLMLMFGWQGATCIDEWTMAACNLGMGAALMLAGSGAYSVDNFLLARNSSFERKGWFRWLAGALPLPVSGAGFRNFALTVLAATVVFNVATYDHYRGSVYSAFHSGPVSPTKHHLALNDAAVSADGKLTFHVYLDGGTPEVPSHIVNIALLGGEGALVHQWDTATLSALPNDAIHNEYAYNKFKTGPFGLVAQMGAMAEISLPLQGATMPTDAKLRVTTVSGNHFEAAVKG